MGFRFRKSIRLLPGVRLNLSASKNGLSPSIGLGVRGANINLSKRGTRTTLGVPGTGLAYVDEKRLPRAKRSRASKVPLVELQDPGPQPAALPPPPPTPEENDASGWGWMAGTAFVFAVVVILAFLAR
jgi:hypothetical protein